MALALGKIASFNGHSLEEASPNNRPHMSEQLKQKQKERENFRKRKDSQRVFEKFHILLIAHDKMQQFAGSCDDYRWQQFNRCW